MRMRNTLISSAGLFALISLNFVETSSGAAELSNQALLREQPKRSQNSLERTKRSAHDLLKRLNELDDNFASYYDYLLASSETDNSYDVQPSKFLVEDNASNQQKIAPAYKRQSSSGAQICIWKVCPPTPWRRARKSRAN